MIIYAPVKINLRLEVLNKRNDNYHELQMINIRGSLKDILTINESTKNEIRFSIEELNHIKNNYCLDILNYMCDAFNLSKHYDIYITKNIPHGAGLGGGSCDAAAIINFINDDNDLNLSKNELIEIAKKFGADIPYCLFDSPAIVTGIGETIDELDYKFIEDIYIIYPNIFVSTKEIFENVVQYDNKTPKDVLIDYIKKNDYDSLLYNGLEKASFKLYPELQMLKERLVKYGYVVMSGSGSAFVLIPNKLTTKEQLEKEFCDCVIY